MDSVSEYVRRISTFLIATLLWLHALFLWNFDSKVIDKAVQILHLTTTETILCGLLVIFSLTAGSSFWKRCKSAAYIYLFPFAIVGYLFYAFYLLLRLVNRWLATQSSTTPISEETLEQQTTNAGESAVQKAESKKQSVVSSLAEFVLRPFRRFMLLWGILLLLATHKQIIWLCLIVISIHLARRIFHIVEICFFSGPFLAKIGTGLLNALDQPLATLAAIAVGTASVQELKSLRDQIKLWRRILDFLKNSYLLTRWAWFLAIVFIGCVHLYFSLYFSFVYYGIFRLSGIVLPWLDALISSIFIPLAYSDLPRTLPIRLVSYIHATIVLLIGIGTIVNFLQKRLDSVRKAANLLSERLVQPDVLANLKALEVKIAPTEANTRTSLDSSGRSDS